MNIDPQHLLRQLEPPVRPAGAPDGAGAPRAPFETHSFGELLTLVSTGSISSDREVAPDPQAGIELSEEQRRRLAAAGDMAEAAGAGMALMLIDGRGLVMDVPERVVTRELASREAGQVVDVDAAVYVAGADERLDAGRLSLPGTGLVPPAVAAQLAARSDELHAETLDMTDPPAARRAG